MSASKKVVVNVTVPASSDDVTVEVNLDLEKLASGVPYTVTTACVSEDCGAPTPLPTPTSSSSTGGARASSVAYYVGPTAGAGPMGLFSGHPDVVVHAEKKGRSTVFSGLEKLWRALVYGLRSRARASTGKVPNSMSSGSA
ncbi:hypothetical protein BV25DRAFT_1841125 [Artomyces pyxidatus]|uniref:Uncharacterized protein n=1 Tax=Artomyces pyxidatus TaxID=48021 RepID=A0ACB8SQV1_9AGAM|nr:hypothetical protein BV25DRAFT_1841125 [Artomyces pyxidatus]